MPSSRGVHSPYLGAETSCRKHVEKQVPKNESYEEQGARWVTSSGGVGTLEFVPAQTPPGKGAPEVT